MLLNHIRIAARNLQKYAGYYALNIGGLAVGIAACFVILFYIQDELSFDRYNERSADTVRLTLETEGGRRANLHASIGERLSSDMPEVESMTRLFTHWEKPLLSVDDRGFIEQRFFFADPSYPDVLSTDFVSGNSADAFSEPYTVILSESTAKKYYPDENPLGKTLIYNSEDELTVTGIYRDVPHNAHFLRTSSHLW